MIELRQFDFMPDCIRIDVWTSMRCPPMNSFFPANQPFVRVVLEIGMPVFKYEDFTAVQAGRFGRTVNQIKWKLDQKYEQVAGKTGAHHGGKAGK